MFLGCWLYSTYYLSLSHTHTHNTTLFSQELLSIPTTHHTQTPEESCVCVCAWDSKCWWLANSLKRWATEIRGMDELAMPYRMNPEVWLDWTGTTIPKQVMLIQKWTISLTCGKEKQVALPVMLIQKWTISLKCVEEKQVALPVMLIQKWTISLKCVEETQVALPVMLIQKWTISLKCVEEKQVALPVLRSTSLLAMLLGAASPCSATGAASESPSPPSANSYWGATGQSGDCEGSGDLGPEGLPSPTDSMTGGLWVISSLSSLHWNCAQSGLMEALSMLSPLAVCTTPWVSWTGNREPTVGCSLVLASRADEIWGCAAPWGWAGLTEAAPDDE